MRKLLALLTAFLFFTGMVYAQKTITGKVTDDKGAPMPNVSVVVPRTTTGTVTKADGTFSLAVPANARQLQFSSVGFATQVVTIGSSSTFSVSMVSEAKEEEEVVVTGLSRISKSKFSGAANKIAPKDLTNKPVGSVDQLFQGRVPGVLALTGSGQPGSASTILIRGTNSISVSSAPLYILDGIQVETSVFQGLNPNDFASIDILRDASTLAQYGSRGANGVIVITTKKGTAGKLKVSYDGQFGVKSKPDFAFRTMTTAEIFQNQYDYGKVVGSSTNNNANIPGWYFSPDNPRVQALTPTGQADAARILDSMSKINTNWYDEIFRRGTFSNHQLTLSGGSGRTRFYTNLALYNEEGITERTDMKRVTLKSNIDYADDKLTYGFSATLGYTRRNFQQSTVTNSLGNPFLVVNLQVPYTTVRNPDGTFNLGNGSKYVATTQMDLNFWDENYNDQMKATLSFNVGYKITKDITAGFIAGVDFRETQNTNYGSKEAYSRKISTSITGNAGFQFEDLTRLSTSTIRPSVTYRKLFNDKHDIEAVVLGEYVQENSKSFSAQGFGIDPRIPNTPSSITQGNAVNQLYAIIGGGKARTGLASGLFTARYTYNDKYTLSGSIRTDGTSKLPEANRWGQFFSVGATWEASREAFIQNIKFINTLRVRASYGSTANASNFGNYPYQATYGAGTYSGINTQVSTYPGNPNLKWETTYILNFGLDFEFLKRRIYGDLNWYDKRTKDLLVNKTLTGPGAAFTAILQNAGELQNTGFEWNINGEVFRTKNLVWTLFATGGYNKNKLLDLGGVQPYASGTSFLKIGLPLGSHNEVGWAGVDAATGMPLYYDLNGKITTVYATSNAVQNWGTWEAPWKGGFGTSLRYKGIDLSVLFSWQSGADKYDNLEYFVENPVGFMAGGYNQSASLNFWKKPGDVVSTPSPLYGTNFSSKLIHDASFVRLRDVTLSYTLPSSIIAKTKVLSSVKLFLQGTNLFIWTHWRGMDPEAGPVNINLSEFPNPRAFTGGITVSFN
ncbi:MAG: SusC/RagA family TonB-linked outer membrane protein [Chitinophagaceae bacterium]|nr:SusC/RagA family TonB-linked outer membrane protein [Chitinophagaceae bacterium]